MVGFQAWKDLNGNVMMSNTNGNLKVAVTVRGLENLVVVEALFRPK